MGPWVVVEGMEGVGLSLRKRPSSFHFLGEKMVVRVVEYFVGENCVEAVLGFLFLKLELLQQKPLQNFLSS